MKLVDLHIRTPSSRSRNYAADEQMHPMQVAHFRRMTVEEKIDALAEMYHLGRSIMAAGIRMRHPDWDDEAVEREVRELMLYGAS